MADQADPATLQMLELEAAALSARNGNFVWIAATVVVLYDHLSTLDLEIELIWKKKWSLVQILFLINRYLPDAGFLYGAFVLVWLPYDKFNTLCPSLSKAQTWFSVLALNSMQAILVHRIICMYRKKPIILYGLSAFWVANFIVAIVFCGFTMVTVNMPIFITNTIRTCVPLNLPSWSLANWCLMLAFDLTIFTFAVGEGVRYLKENTEILNRHGTRRFLVVNKWAKQGKMMRILLRDSIVFPFIGLTISVFNILAWYVLPLGGIQSMMAITAAASPILGCRLILHLRDAYYQPFASELLHYNGVSKTQERVHFSGGDSTVQSSLRSMVASKINPTL